jgi:hypothetical protein
MTRSRSLGILATWARYAHLPANAHQPNRALAQSHGLAAVRAIRPVELVPGCPAPHCPDILPILRHVVSESRLAFRAALAAVGIRGAL